MRSTNIKGPIGTIHIIEASPPVTAAESEPLPVVFVHGMAVSASIWEAQLAHVARTRRAIALDVRGHGDSAPPEDGNYAPASCVADVLAVLDGLGLDRVAIVGHSFGAFIALATAATAPHRIAQLMLADPPGDFTKVPADVYELIVSFQRALEMEDWRAAVETSFNEALTGSRAQTRDRILACLAATPRDCLRGMYRGMFAFEAVDALDRYLAAPGTPAHAIIAPSNTFPFSLHILRPTLTTTTIPDTGHWLMLDAPEAFARELDICLEGV
ncbi:alpha/beta fold hydrolase [Microcoleus sp. herbarium5]|uniref:alpha/beta fold hydrolase n=1 Tax=Microcoleus sp. herbarium5 TaxID=3055434 RepID=UPI002FD38102